MRDLWDRWFWEHKLYWDMKDWWDIGRYKLKVIKAYIHYAPYVLEFARRNGIGKVEGYFWHLHHTEGIEITYDLWVRVRYIVTYKPKEEVPLRLSCIRRSSKNYNAHEKECGCMYWYGGNIFSGMA